MEIQDKNNLINLDLMNTNKSKSRLLWGLIIVFQIVSFSACSEMDDYKDYVEGGEITYTGKIEDIEVHPGHNRILLTGLLKSDPKITTVKLYWNSEDDSLVTSVNRTAGVDTVSLLLENMEENVYNFMFYTSDDYGNLSIPENQTGKVYGDKYLASLNNRLIESAEMIDTGVLINWGDAGYLDGLIATEVLYTDENDNQLSVFQDADSDENEMILAEFKSGTTFNYRSLFVPDTMAIDTFYTPYNLQGVLAEITNQYIANAGDPFEYSSWDGSRWGILDGWITNDAIKNADGYGGYELRSGVGNLSMEAGWGLPAARNGKIYQVVNLPAGKYSFEIDLETNGSGGTKYIVSSVGNELPDFDDVAEQALIFADISLEEISFELSEPAAISLGFVCDLPGDGEYCKISAVRLYSLP